MKKALIHIVGGGLAGCEAAWQCLRAGHEVRLYEMRPKTMTPAHSTGDLAELVCSNSLKSMLADSAPGLLKSEMQALDSLILKAGAHAAVPAGQALAVERTVFSQYILEALESFPGFTRVDTEVTELPAIGENEAWIIASGPLTSQPLVDQLQGLCQGSRRLHFYDAIAPILETDSIDESIVFRASRYDDSGDGDYWNIPLNKEEYEAFVDAVIAAEKMPLHDFEDVAYFESCLPIEVMIERGRDTLRFGPMKPVGLTDPRTGHRPWAAVQLRMENKEGTMVSMVGFQTKMKWPEQKRVFSMLPGLKDVEFFRFGSVHRNSYLKSPEVLNADLSFKTAPRIFLAGQITGVEGYTESAAIGLLAGRAASAKVRNESFLMPPTGTIIGALYRYITEGGLGDFQPMNANLGLLPALPKQRGMGKPQRKALQCARSREVFAAYQAQISGSSKTYQHGEEWNAQAGL